MCASGLMSDIFRLIDGCVDLKLLRQTTLLLNALLDDSCKYHSSWSLADQGEARGSNSLLSLIHI